MKIDFGTACTGLFKTEIKWMTLLSQGGKNSDVNPELLALLPLANTHAN